MLTLMSKPFDKKIFQQRRQALMAGLSTDDVIIACTAPLQLRNGDTHYPFRPHSDFYYCTGFDEPDALMVLCPDGKGSGRFILFSRQQQAERACWEGDVIGQEKAKTLYGADQAYPIKELDDHLPDLLQGRSRWWLSLEHHPTWHAWYKDWQRGQNLSAQEIETLGDQLHPMRRIKSQEEIEAIQEAVSISVNAHIAVMQHCKPGINEADLSAILWQHMITAHSHFPAYPHIVAGGTNACTLHYHQNNQRLRDGDCLLVDAGAEAHCYAADITRTMPINGQFNREQQAIYECVLAAQEAVINHIQPGVAFADLQQIACRLLLTGLKDHGILEGDLDDLMADKAYLPFYMHGIGHWLGLDVHDVGDYGHQGDIMLQAGMVLTVEPGLYMNPLRGPLDEKWHHIGVRIEDDVLVTPTGHRVLSEDCPKQVDDIIKTMKS